ncbi:MAG: GTP 3',8-cyclase MoaA [Pseudomonadota bacterium]
MFIDSFGRQISYLRLSITDRCNLYCRYCMPLAGARKSSHSEILRYEELLRIVRVSSSHGIKKVRITGGEPLFRRGVVSFLDMLGRVDGLEEIGLTTNGVLLAEMFDGIYGAGIRKVNVSLDTLDPAKYKEITSQPCWGEVWKGIQRALTARDMTVKINVVVMKGINDDEIESFVRLAREYPFQVRFIEFMPIGCGSRWSKERYFPGDEVLQRLRRTGDLIQIPKKENAGPAVVYKLSGGAGEVGLITPVSNSFCNSCNRMRITPDGRLRMCLFSDDELDLKKALRSDIGDDDVLSFLKEAVKRKPPSHTGPATDHFLSCHRQMSQIGG